MPDFGTYASGDRTALKQALAAGNSGNDALTQHQLAEMTGNGYYKPSLAAQLMSRIYVPRWLWLTAVTIGTPAFVAFTFWYCSRH